MGGHHIATLNGRQRVVSNLVRQACSAVPDLDWLFFLDGDEVVMLDPVALSACPIDVDAVRLLPLEAVAGTEGNGRQLFKRLLTKPELRRLRRAGLLDRANNARYFHGHVSGKVGIRPGADLRFGVHAATDPAGDKVEHFTDPRLRHLHYESPTFDEFVRKWTALASSGPPPGMRDRRAVILEAFVEFQHETDEDVLAARQRALYDDFVAEDVAGLLAQGVLESIEVSEPTWQGKPLEFSVRSALEHALRETQLRPKREFLPVPTRRG